VTNRIFKLLFPLIFGFALAANAQTMLLNTTLSAAVGNTSSSALTTGSLGVVTVASATGISAPAANTSNTMGPATSAAQTYLYVDKELMQVVSVNGTSITVIRGIGPTVGASHATGAVVLVIPAQYNGGSNTAPGYVPSGSCTRTNELYLPHVEFASGTISDCLGGQWVNGDARQTTRATQWRIQAPITGAQTSGAVFGTNSTITRYSMYCTEIDMTYSKLVTGLAFHTGTTGTSSDLWAASLYDSGGNLIANSVSTGTAPGAGYAWSPIALTAKYYVVGPGQYYGCVTPIAAVTATLDTIAAAKGDNTLTYVGTGTSTTTLPASFTIPTGFNASAGPFLYVY
jgi:hypothetical protein